MSSAGRKRFAWRRTAAALGVFALFTGMLFWTKLRTVSEIPRSAYAVPREKATPEPVDAAEQADGEAPTAQIDSTGTP